MYVPFSTPKQLANSKSNAVVYQAHDSVRFDQDQITDIPEPVSVHSWLDHTITSRLVILHGV